MGAVLGITRLARRKPSKRECKMHMERCLLPNIFASDCKSILEMLLEKIKFSILWGYQLQIKIPQYLVQTFFLHTHTHTPEGEFSVFTGKALILSMYSLLPSFSLHTRGYELGSWKSYILPGTLITGLQVWKRNKQPPMQQHSKP